MHAIRCLTIIICVSFSKWTFLGFFFNCNHRSHRIEYDNMTVLLLIIQIITITEMKRQRQCCFTSTTKNSDKPNQLLQSMFEIWGNIHFGPTEWVFGHFVCLTIPFVIQYRVKANLYDDAHMGFLVTFAAHNCVMLGQQLLNSAKSLMFVTSVQCLNIYISMMVEQRWMLQLF